MPVHAQKITPKPPKPGTLATNGGNPQIQRRRTNGNFSFGWQKPAGNKRGEVEKPSCLWTSQPARACAYRVKLRENQTVAPFCGGNLGHLFFSSTYGPRPQENFFKKKERERGINPQKQKHFAFVPKAFFCFPQHGEEVLRLFLPRAKRNVSSSVPIHSIGLIAYCLGLALLASFAGHAEKPLYGVSCST